MRYTKIALLIFGAGLVLGLTVVVAELHRLDRVASGLMAVGLAAIPTAMAIDWRRATKAAPPRARKRPSSAARRRNAGDPARRLARPRRPGGPK
jgi:hypothetical protein